MKMKGVIHEVAPGVWSPYPQTREQALEENIVKYHPIPAPVCPRCGQKAVRYTVTDICAACAYIDAADAFNQAQAAGQPTSPTAARLAGLSFYWRPEPGRYCGHIGLTTFGGKCEVCRADKEAKPESPRQAARAAGETWYQPAEGDLCRNGHNAPRRVNNGSCQRCEEEARQRRPADPEPIWKTSPDLIISREDARAFGMVVYRTGQPCKRGHASFRYVSNGGCLVCMGRLTCESI